MLKCVVLCCAALRRFQAVRAQKATCRWTWVLAMDGPMDVDLDASLGRPDIQRPEDIRRMPAWRSRAKLQQRDLALIEHVERLRFVDGVHWCLLRKERDPRLLPERPQAENFAAQRRHGSDEWRLKRTGLVTLSFSFLWCALISQSHTAGLWDACGREAC